MKSHVPIGVARIALSGNVRGSNVVALKTCSAFKRC
jgi:hypothetical protein